MKRYPTRRTSRIVTAQRLAILALAVVVLVPLSAGAQEPAEPQPVEVFPPYAQHVLFVDDTVEPPTCFSFATNLQPSTVLGKPVITGQFVLLNDPEPTVMAIVFLPTENPSEYWGLASNGYYLLVKIHPDLSLTWIDPIRGGPAFLF